MDQTDRSGAEEEGDESGYEIVRATARFEMQTRLSRGQTDEERARRKALLHMLSDVSRLATTARNAGMRENWRADSAVVDALRAEGGGELPKKIAWTKRYSYPTMRAAAPRLSSNIAATLQRDVDRKWCQDRFDVLVRQIKSFPQYRVGQPFPVPKASVKLYVNEDKSVLVTLPVLSEKHDGERRVVTALVPRDDYQKTVLAKIASGDWRIGAATIEQDRLRPDRWYLKLAYKRRIEKATSGAAAGINRGIRFFLCAVTDSGEEWIYDGADIVAYLRQIQRRRRMYQNQVSASARVGHGRTRTLRPIEHLTGKAERWRKTRCQVIARRFALWCQARGVSRVYIEDFSGIRDGEPERLEGGVRVWNQIQEWPYYQLEMRVKSSLEELGIEVIQKDAHWVSQTCPSCGHTSPDNVDLGRWRIRCVKCKRSRHLDTGASANLLARGEEDRKKKLLGVADEQNVEPAGKKKPKPKKGRLR